jgi:hypothetical protein
MPKLERAYNYFATTACFRERLFWENGLMQAFLLAAAAASALGVDVGWQQTDNGEMEYIIQLEPHQVTTLKKGDVIEVGVRPDLRNVRRYRIVVGEDKLPRESAAPKLTIDSPAFSAKPLERSGDLSVVVPKDASGQPVWSEPAIPAGRSSTATFEEPDSYGTDTGSSGSASNATGPQPGGATPIDHADAASVAANDDLRYNTIPPANSAGDAVAADETTPPPARFIDPPPFRENPYAAQDAATGADPQLGTRYSSVETPAYNPPSYTGSTSFQQPGETLTSPPRPLITESPQGNATHVATAVTSPNAKSGTKEDTAQPQTKGDKEPSDTESSEQAAPKPWALFTVTLFALFASLGGNFYLGWMNWDMRQRFRSLIRRMKIGDSKGRDSGDDLD